MAIIYAHSNRWTNEILWEIIATEISTLPQILTQSQQAFVSRSQTPTEVRIGYIQSFLDQYIAHRDEIAQSISLEIGKAITHSYADVDYDIGYVRWHLEHAQQILSPEIIYQDEHEVHTQYYEARGVTAVISPWNYPTSQRVREVIPALLAGNTIIYKSASACIWTAKLLSDLLISSLPAGVFQPIYGNGDLGNELTKLPVAQIIFTWSTAVGQTIQTNASTTLAHTHLELGGSAPGIVLPNTPIDDAMIQMIDYFRIRHAGQICDGLKRLFVHHSQKDELIMKLSDYFRDIAIGNPMSPDTRMWSLISEQAKLSVQSAIDQSVSMWAIKIELWILDDTSWPFVPITILTDVTLDMPVMNTEIFWPVIPIMTYETLDEVIWYANATVYWLGWYLWWTDQSQINYVCSKIKTWNIAVNSTSYLIPQVPFGGYTPASGNMREHGAVGLRSYCETKVVSMPA
jgi:acyl-CoA reductase-like NAD-dependent aldehyde dehydrogenase